MRNSFGAGIVLAAAQLGVGNGLGILDTPLSLSAMRGWGHVLTWVAFMFAVGVAGGAVVGRRALRRPRPTLTVSARVAAAGAAGLGAAAALPLVWLPVRVNYPTVDPRAEVTMAVTAGVGVLVGMALAVAALTWKSVTAGITTSAAWVWLFALASVGFAAKDHVRVNPRLGMIDAPRLIPAGAWWLGPYLMVGIAALVGLLVAASAGWRGTGWSGIVLSGLAGPALVAFAYLTTGWGVSGDTEDATPYVASLLAVGAGVLTSMAVASATIPHRPAPRPAVAAASRARRLALASLPTPLAITAYAEPAYVLESSFVEPPYRRQPAFYNEPIYLPAPRPHHEDAPRARPEPAARPDLNRRPEPAAEAAYELSYPEVSHEVASEAASRYEPGHAAAVEAVVVEPVAIGAGGATENAAVEDAVVVEMPAKPASEPHDVTPVGVVAVRARVVRGRGAVSPTRGRKGRATHKDKDKDKDRVPSGRRGRHPDNDDIDRPLRQVERDHIDWIDKLVKLPADPTLKITKER
ncbi:MAG: hypothetical protein QOE61_3476 [Micromonosporaceae bacterium]|jgi:hypothetical protein|nr:hypothetical protein [Micromonosporaceae bacterium]